MDEFDFYINLAKPSLGLYVRKGAGLPDLADASAWQLDGTMTKADITPALLKELEANGHAFEELDSE
jgi:hypothetical protein